MRLIFTLDAWRDYVKWSVDDPAILARINLLLEECVRHPFTGTGKPEPLRRNLSGGGRGGSIASIGWCIE